MFLTAAPLHVVLLSLSATSTAALGVYAYYNRQEPGASAFVVLMASMTVWSGAYAMALLTLDPFLRPALDAVQWFGIATIHVWLLLFALAYTGHDEFVTRRTVALIGAIPALTVFLVWTNPLHQLMWTEYSLVVVDGLVVMDRSWGPLFWVDVLYAYALIAVASALILRLIFLSDYLYADQSALLLVGIAAPFVSNAFDIFAPTPQPTIDPTPYAFTVTGLTFGYALFRRRLFDLVPATRQLGRNAAISQLDAGIVIVDDARRIVYCNDAAGEVLGRDPADALGSEVRSLVDDSRIDWDTDDALAEIERDDRLYEIRTSPVTDRRDRCIGHTLVVHDVTARERRAKQLAAQRDELATVNDLNAVIRGVNQALVSATSCEEIERAVCERVADADLYRTACIADVATWTGDADRWFVAGDGSEGAPPALDADGFDTDALDDAPDDGPPTLAPDPPTDGGTWTVVPVVYGRTVYGALGLYTDRETVSDRERAVLAELGETIGQAINAVETSRLLSAEAVVELELESTDDADPLATASGDLDCQFDVAGLVPSTDEGHLAYVRVAGAAAADARDELESVAGDVRTIRDGDDDGLLEWSVTGDALLGTLVEYGANVQRVDADDGRARYAVEIASDADVRALVDHVERQFPDAVLVAKRERAGPVEESGGIPGESLDDLTDRQREVMEAAYRAGYFNWPRDSTAEEVAESLEIAPPTLHAHLRKAEASLLTDLFDGGAGPSEARTRRPSER